MAQSGKKRAPLLSYVSFKVILISLFPVFFVSCASTKVQGTTDRPYYSVLDKWSRGGKIYRNFETIMIFNATYKTGEFREAYAGEYAEVYALEAGPAQKLMEEETDAVTRYHEFFLSFHTPEEDWDGLEAKDPLFHVYLANDSGRKVQAVEIKKVKEQRAELVRFYPYLDPWSKAYSVKFPIMEDGYIPFITEETGYIKLIVSGPPGKGEVMWKLRD